jgi:hypothetical protein
LDHSPSLGRGADRVKHERYAAHRADKSTLHLQEHLLRTSVTAAVGKTVHVGAAHITAPKWAEALP